jgi:lipopolysaccharide transport system ATP-binding protein
MKPIIRVEGLSKQYRLGTQREPYGSLRESLVRAMKAPFKSLRRNGRSTESTIWALKDVSFEVMPGEVVGIIGRNGAGKSTLLKILSQITEPASGQVDLFGRVGSLLEVGTGFHPELSGRENIYLNGAILGMKRVEIDSKFDEIVAFAEVEKFLDTPVKHYSSGMYTRLAFSVAAHLEPEILLVDEVLAVGDAEFQKKCLGKMSEVAEAGRTVLFVSHNMAAVQKLCPRSILLRGGQVEMDAETQSVIREYTNASSCKAGNFNISGRHNNPIKVKVLNAWLHREGMQTDTFIFDDMAELFLEIEVMERCQFSVELILRQADNLPVAFAPSGLAQDWEVGASKGSTIVKAQLPNLKLAAGIYSFDIILAETGVQFLDYIESAISFNVDSTAIGGRNWMFFQARGQGHSLLDVKYSVVN